MDYICQVSDEQTRMARVGVPNLNLVLFKRSIALYIQNSNALNMSMRIFLRSTSFRGRAEASSLPTVWAS